MFLSTSNRQFLALLLALLSLSATVLRPIAAQGDEEEATADGEAEVEEDEDEDDDDEEEDGDDESDDGQAQGGWKSHRGLSVVASTPDLMLGKVTQGDVVESLVGLSNIGQDAFNITGIYGQLYDVSASQAIQNLTSWPVQTALAPGEELTVMYPFKPYPRLPIDREFQVVAHVFYTLVDQPAETFLSQALNMTITMAQPQVDHTGNVVFVTMLVLVIMSVLMWGTIASVLGISKSAAKSSASGSDWLPATAGPSKRKTFGRK